MAMIKCSACGKDISDKAEKCVHCGAVVESVPKIKCEECGTLVSTNEKLCPNCGCPLDSATNSEATVKKEKNKKRKKWYIPVIIILLVLAGCASYLLFFGGITTIASELAKRGEYEKAYMILSYDNFDDATILKEELYNESCILAAIKEMKKGLFKPSSFELREVELYDAHDGKNHPIVVVSLSAENKLGGAVAGYTYIFHDGTKYQTYGFVNTLKMEDQTDSLSENICSEINSIIKYNRKITEFDELRIKEVIKNDNIDVVSILE